MKANIKELKLSLYNAHFHITRKWDKLFVPEIGQLRPELWEQGSWAKYDKMPRIR